jgi:hypothetical protein
MWGTVAVNIYGSTSMMVGATGATDVDYAGNTITAACIYTN